VLVALANPLVFAVTATAPNPERIGTAGTFSTAFVSSPFMVGGDLFMDADSALRCQALYNNMWMMGSVDSRYAVGRCGAYAYGPGSGWNQLQPEVQLVSRGGSAPTPPKGRAVNGQGYTTGRGANAGSSASTAPSSRGAASASESAGGNGEHAAAASPGGGYSGGSSTGSTDRTAKPRP
jgi:hypothetical protein